MPPVACLERLIATIAVYLVIEGLVIAPGVHSVAIDSGWATPHNLIEVSIL